MKTVLEFGVTGYTDIYIKNDQIINKLFQISA